LELCELALKEREAVELGVEVLELEVALELVQKLVLAVEQEQAAAVVKAAVVKVEAVKAAVVKAAVVKAAVEEVVVVVRKTLTKTRKILGTKMVAMITEMADMKVVEVMKAAADMKVVADMEVVEGVIKVEAEVGAT
jgi:hypothetical protein